MKDVVIRLIETAGWWLTGEEEMESYLMDTVLGLQDEKVLEIGCITM